MNQVLDKCCISTQGTIRDALVALQKGSIGILFVIDEQGKLRGALTDGDLRRAILADAPLSDPFLPFVNAKVTLVPSSASRAEVLDLMQAMRIEQIPAVDADGTLRKVHLLHELLGAVGRPNWAVIMAGGKGTRLGELTRALPKPMLKVAGRPILERLVLHFVGYGIRRIFLSVGYLSEIIESHFGDGSGLGCQIEYLREEEPLGTGGPLSLLPEAPTAPIFVCNGDIVTQANLEQLLLFHEAGGFGITVGLTEYTHQIPFGCLQLEETRVVRLEEKPTLSRPINAGIYVMEPKVIARVPRRFFPITELIEQCLLDNIPIGGCPLRDEWIDVGHKEELTRAQHGETNP